MYSIQKSHLLDVKDKEIFDGADGGQQRAVEGADPADGLTVDDLQDVLRNRELLLAQPLRQGRLVVLDDQPDGTAEIMRHSKAFGGNTSRTFSYADPK